ncbi:TPA: SDR family oxidoreductase [Klebsiella pneumoniae]|uniref:SDR family oxidoreductase n=1 Tax=Enterobacter cloacae TaxID=550 RepID=UPI0031E23A29
MIIENSKILVAGGTGALGEGIVRTLLQQGANVLVPTRDAQKVEKLREYVADVSTGSLEGVIGSLSTPEDAARLAEAIARSGPLNAIVASIGGWTQGHGIADVPFDVWENVIRDNLTPHFLAMKYLSPLLADKSAYVHMNGMSAEMAWPNAGPIAAMAAAQKSLALTFAEESYKKFNVYEVILPPVNTRARQGRGRPEWPTAEEVGQYVAGILERNDGTVLNRYEMKTH